MTKTVNLDLLVADPNQPRQEFDIKALDLLKNSIKSKGILVPLAVEKMANGKYLLIDGERRYRAAKAVGLEEVPVIIYETMDDVERISTRFHLQEQHSNWTAFDKAKAISILKQATGMSTQEIADSLGMPYTTLATFLTLLLLSKRTVKYANEKKLNFKLISKIAYTVKAVEDVSLKHRVEDALIDKLERGVVVTSEDISTYSTCIRFLNEDKVAQNKLISKIISDPDFTPKAAAELSKRGDYIQQKKVVHSCTSITTYAQRVMNTKADFSLTPDELKVIDKAINTLEEFKLAAKN